MSCWKVSRFGPRDHGLVEHAAQDQSRSRRLMVQPSPPSHKQTLAACVGMCGVVQSDPDPRSDRQGSSIRVGTPTGKSRHRHSPMLLLLMLLLPSSLDRARCRVGNPFESQGGRRPEGRRGLGLFYAFLLLLDCSATLWHHDDLQDSWRLMMHSSSTAPPSERDMKMEKRLSVIHKSSATPRNPRRNATIAPATVSADGDRSRLETRCICLSRY